MSLYKNIILLVILIILGFVIFNKITTDIETKNSKIINNYKKKLFQIKAENDSLNIITEKFIHKYNKENDSLNNVIESKDKNLILLKSKLYELRKKEEKIFKHEEVNDSSKVDNYIDNIINN